MGVCGVVMVIFLSFTFIWWLSECDIEDNCSVKRVIATVRSLSPATRVIVSCTWKLLCVRDSYLLLPLHRGILLVLWLTGRSGLKV